MIIDNMGQLRTTVAVPRNTEGHGPPAQQRAVGHGRSEAWDAVLAAAEIIEPYDPRHKKRIEPL
jgi:hypothetical protein